MIMYLLSMYITYILYIYYIYIILIDALQVGVWSPQNHPALKAGFSAPSFPDEVPSRRPSLRKNPAGKMDEKWYPHDPIT
jgi:hypothetical protein